MAARAPGATKEPAAPVTLGGETETVELTDGGVTITTDDVTGAVVVEAAADDDATVVAGAAELVDVTTTADDEDDADAEALVEAAPDPGMVVGMVIPTEEQIPAAALMALRISSPVQELAMQVPELVTKALLLHEQVKSVKAHPVAWIPESRQD